MQITKQRQKIRFSPVALLVHGLSILPTFLLQEVLLFRIIQTIIFIILSLSLENSIKGKMKTLFFSFFSFLFILVFHLFTPNGEVLYRILSFPVTLGAIHTGIFKGTVFTGLLALSKITVMKNLTLPGPAGKMISKVFYYFNRLKEIQGKFKTKNPVKRIDLMLLEISADQDINNPAVKEQKIVTSCTGIFCISLSVLFHWGILILSWYYPEIAW
jgi:hypothetical protein